MGCFVIRRSMRRTKNGYDSCILYNIFLFLGERFLLFRTSNKKSEPEKHVKRTCERSYDSVHNAYVYSTFRLRRSAAAAVACKGRFRRCRGKAGRVSIVATLLIASSKKKRLSFARPEQLQNIIQPRASFIPETTRRVRHVKQSK